MLKLKKVRLRTWIILFLVLIIVLVFDVFEILLGNFMYVTNPIRPKTGRLWEEELKDMHGSAFADSISTSSNQDRQATPIRTYDELIMIVTVSGSYEMNRTEFVEFYKNLPFKTAQKLLNSDIVYDLMRGSVWNKVRFTLQGDQLGLFCINGYNQIITDNYIYLDKKAERPENSGLENMPNFKGRTISGEQFRMAYDQLTKNVQRQIVGDNYSIIQWESNLKRVGISNVEKNGSVEIAFEVNSPFGMKIEKRIASKLAVEWLLKYLKAEGINIPSPVVPVK